MLGCRNQWELPAYFERNKPRASKKIAGKNLSYTTGRLEKLLTGCWYVWNRLDHYQRIGTSQMLFRCALMTLTGAWPRGLWITPFSFMNAAIKFERLEVMEERELASERIVKYEEMCGRNVTIIMAVFPLNGLVHLTEQIGRMKARLFNDFFAQDRTWIRTILWWLNMMELQHVGMLTTPEQIQSLRCCLLTVCFSQHRGTSDQYS